MNLSGRMDAFLNTYETPAARLRRTLSDWPIARITNPYTPPIAHGVACKDPFREGPKRNRHMRLAIFIGLLAAAPLFAALSLLFTQPTTGSSIPELESPRQLVLRNAAAFAPILLLFACMLIPSLATRGRSRWILLGSAASCTFLTVLWIVFTPR